MAASLAAAATAAESPATRDGRVGLGKGIFVTSPGNTTEFPDKVKANAHIAGFQAAIVWPQLEPRKGEFDWSLIDNFLAECAKCGKQAAFKFITVDGKVMSDGQLAKGKRPALSSAPACATVIPAAPA